MCGIAFFYSPRGQDASLPSSVMPEMLDRIEHRGPDGYGMAVGDPNGNVSLILNGRDKLRSTIDWNFILGHRRLAILDTSDAGLQPMCRGQFWMTYNGEVYNYIELRSELEKKGYAFTTGTDTEVILSAYAEWGLDAFERFNGMFAIVIVDLDKSTVVYARDRLGIKPLYKARLSPRSGEWCLISEPKQMLSVPGFSAQAEPEVLERYLSSGYGGTGKTFFKGIENVPPGMVFQCRLDDGALIQNKSFWQPERVEVNTDMTKEEAARLVRESLLQATRLRLRSDVPVAAALSGGLDSSSIVALMAGELSTTGLKDNIKTFSVLFSGSNVDETPFVNAVIEQTGVQNIAVTPTFDEWWADKSDWAYHHDEPVGSTAQYAAYQLAKATREAGCPVSLNGQGGDEVFAGYWQSCFANMFSMLRNGDVLSVAKNFLGAALPGGNPDLIMQVPFIASRFLERRQAKSSGVSEVVGMSIAQRRIEEIRTIHLPRLLKWDDRNLMAFSVEGRYPFLDHTLIEKMLTIPPELLYERGWIKAPLRRGMKGILPESIRKRRSKWGFETPQETWWRQNQETLRLHLSESRLRGSQWFDEAEVDGLFEMLSGNADASRKAGHLIFRLIMLDVWASRFDVMLD